MFLLTRRSLVDDITARKAAADNAATASAVLGPFFRHDHPVRQFGSSITFNTPKDAQVAYVHGVVKDGKTGDPIHNAVLDIWQASTNGMPSNGACKPLLTWSRALRAAGCESSGAQSEGKVLYE